LTIDNPPTLLGPNAGVPGSGLSGYGESGIRDERGPEAIIAVPENVGSDNLEDNDDPVIFVESSGVTIDGFRITGDNGNGKANYASCNIQAGYGICAYSDGELSNLIFRNNVIDCFTICGVYTRRDESSQMRRL